MTREEYQSTVRVYEAVRIFENWRTADYNEKLSALRLMKTSTSLSTKLAKYEILRAMDWLIGEYLKEVDKNETADV